MSKGGQIRKGRSSVPHILCFCTSFLCIFKKRLWYKFNNAIPSLSRIKNEMTSHVQCHKRNFNKFNVGSLKEAISPAK